MDATFLSLIPYYLLLININEVQAWNNEDLELFDLVEEVKQNFYDFLGLDEKATTQDVRKTYRKLTLQYHPDKNKEEGAEEKFRRIVAVSEVLKDEGRRKQYDEILRNGLPDWRQPIFYYRRVRKMGLLEMVFFLFTLLTVGQYIVAWSVYWEKKYEIEEVLSSRFKRSRKKKGKQQENESENIIAEQINQIPQPKFSDLFPIAFTKLSYEFIINLPIYWDEWKERRNQKIEEEYEDSSDDTSLEDKVRKPRKRIRPELPDYCDLIQADNSSIQLEQKIEQNEEVSEDISTKKWTVVDSLALTKAMNKFPGGTSQRWEKIAKMIKWPVSEVTKRAKSMKASSTLVQVPVSLQGVTGKDALNQNGLDLLEPKKTKTMDVLNGIAKHGSSETLINAKRPEEEVLWSQLQQKALEKALQLFPKGVEERWEKIALAVDGKTKEDCILRCKALVDLVKQKKSTQERNESNIETKSKSVL